MNSSRISETTAQAHPIRVLMVEHESADIELAKRALLREGLEVEVDVAGTRQELENKLNANSYDVVLADYRLPGWTGLDALEEIQKRELNLPLVLVTGTLGEEKAVECIQLGVADYVLKDQLTRLPLALRRALEQKALSEERARTAKTLEESAASFRFLFAKNPIPMMVIDRETLRYLEVNEAAIHQYGYSREEFLKLLATEIRKPEEGKRLVEFLKQKRGDRAKAGIWHHLTKDGRTIEVEIIAHEMDFHNRPALLVAALNVTEKRALESQLRQAQKFEAIGQLAGGIAHDFNNMLGAILGWVELGIDDSSSNNQLQNYFLKVKHQAERAAELTHQLLAFARRQILEPRNMDLNHSVREVTGLLAKVIRSDIELKLSLEENLPAVKADPTQVEQVIMNLCLNARDALPQGGKLEIRTYSTELTERYCQTHKGARVGPHVCLAVSDTGTGIDPQTLERIFEPFFTTKDVGKGTGLGLATVYGIVKQHGGFIDVRSQIGNGTHFEVFFPASLGTKDVEPKLAYAKPAQRGQETVLLAEDHEGLREIASTTLAGLGYHVKLAHDGVQAVEEFLARPDEIALVLLDIVLPRLNGAEAYARMSSARPGLPVVFVTGYSADSEIFRSVLERKLPLLQKPYGPRELAQKVREALDRKEQFAFPK